MAILGHAPNPATDAPIDRPDPRSGARLGAGPTSNGHVLIVDDNPINLKVCSTFCDLFGFTFECAADGDEALEAAVRTEFDLILMDIHMPRMNGIEATRAIRALPSPVAHAPIIAVTTDAGVQEERTYRASGFTDVVAKPIRPARLLEAMSTALRAAQGDQASRARNASSATAATRSAG